MRRHLSAVAVAVAVLLAGCACDTSPQVVTQPVNVAVPVQCPITVDADPQYPDTDEALAVAPDVFEGVKLLKAGRLMRMAREKELRAAAVGCGVKVTK